MTIRRINGMLMYVFFVLVFLIHYKTTLGTGTLHSWILFLGCLITVPRIAEKCIQSNYRLPVDYTLVAFMALILVLGFVMNIRDVQALNLQAYLLGLATYVFVRENMPSIRLRFFYSLNTLFLLGNSALMIAQFLTGRFFVAQYLAAGNPPLLLPCGFADGPTKNGMIHAAALSLVFAKVMLLRVPILSLDVLALLLGGLSLILTVSRAGVAAFAIAAMLTIVLAATLKKGVELRARRFLSVLVVSLVAAATVFLALWYVRSGSVESDIGMGTANVVSYKFVPREGQSPLFQEVSINTRIATLKAAGQFLVSNPASALFGSGLGSFERIYERISPTLDLGVEIIESEISSHNSYIEFFIEGGIITFCMWLYLIIHVVRKVLARPDAAMTFPVLSALISTMAFMLFHDVIRGRMFWMPLGILASIAYNKRSVDLGQVSRRRRRRTLKTREPGSSRNSVPGPDAG